MELVKLNGKDFGLTSSKAKEVSALFKPMLDKMEGLEAEYNSIVGQERTPELSAAAKALRLRYVKVRTGTAAIHKDLKAFYLNGGKFVDAWKNSQAFISGPIENELMAVEKHFEFLEAERVLALQEERLTEVMQWIDYEKDHSSMQDPKSLDLGGMDDEIYANFLTGMEMGYKQRRAAEKAVEEAEQLKQEEDALHSKRHQESRKYFDYMEEHHKDAYFGKWEQKIWDDQMVEWKAADTAHHKEQEKIKKAAIAKQKATEKALAKERQAREKVEKELAAKKAADLAEAKRIEEEDQAKLAQGDAANMRDLIEGLRLLKSYTFKSKKNKAIMLGICALIDKIVIYAQQK